VRVVTRFEHIVCAVTQGLLAQEGQGENGTWPTREACAGAILSLADAIEAKLVERDKLATEERNRA
jgi:hypothetical protein